MHCVQAIERYRSRIVEQAMEDMYDNLQNAEGTSLEAPETKYRSAVYQKAPVLAKFSLKIRKPCTVFPSLESDESCECQVLDKKKFFFFFKWVWGGSSLDHNKQWYGLEYL